MNNPKPAETLNLDKLIQQSVQHSLENQPAKPPPHKTERVFRKYEHHILTILQNWPSPTTFFPTDLALTTFSCRLRDAINSVIEYGWTSPVDVNLLKRVRSEGLEIAVHNQPPSVIAGKRPTKTDPADALSKIVEQDTHLVYTCIVDNPPRPVIHALAILHSKSILVFPSKLTNVDPNLTQEVKQTYGETLGLTQEGTTVIML